MYVAKEISRKNDEYHLVDPLWIKQDRMIQKSTTEPLSLQEQWGRKNNQHLLNGKYFLTWNIPKKDKKWLLLCVLLLFLLNGPIYWIYTVLESLVNTEY